MMKRVYFIMIVIVVTVISMDSCYYDKGSELGRTCDTTEVTYSNQVSSIIDLNCIECHGAGGTANPKLDTYDQVNIQVQNGSFLGTIKHEAGYSPMRSAQMACMTKWGDKAPILQYEDEQ